MHQLIPQPFLLGFISLVFLAVLQAGNNGGRAREGWNTTEFCVGFRVESQVFVLNMQILWQLDGFQCVQWECGVDRGLIECDDIGWNYKKQKKARLKDVLVTEDLLMSIVDAYKWCWLREALSSVHCDWIHRSICPRILLCHQMWTADHCRRFGCRKMLSIRELWFPHQPVGCTVYVIANTWNTQKTIR